MKKSLSKSAIYGILFLLSFSNIHAFCPADSTGVMTWKEMMDSCKAYQRAQDYQTALKWALQAEVKAKAEFGEMDTNYVFIISKISGLYDKSGNLDSAIYYGNIDLKICRTLFKVDHPFLAVSINKIGYLYNEKGNYKEAEPLYKEALEMGRRLFKGDHPNLATYINNMAYFYNTRGNYKESEPLYKESIEMQRRLFKGDHKDLANSIMNIANIYDNMEKDKEAEPLYKEALEMLRRLFKNDHPDLVQSITSMGNFYGKMGNYIEAESLLREALEISRRSFKGDNLVLANCINNIALYYNKKAYYIEAEPLYKEALEMYRRLFKGNHPFLAQSINNVAVFFNGMGNYKEAEPLYKESLEMQRRLFKGDHPVLAGFINEMAAFYLTMGNYIEAESLFREALEMVRRLFQNDHPFLASCINNMGYIYDKRGNYNDAELLLRESLEMKRRLFKGDNTDLAVSIINMASLYNKRGSNDEAEALYREALEMNRRLFKGDHSDLARSISNMAGFYDAMGELSKAEPLYIEALEMSRRIYKTEHPNLAGRIGVLAEYYHNRGDDTRAEPLYFESLDMYKNIFINQSINLSQSEKEKFWNTMKWKFEGFLSFAAIRAGANPQILSNMYDLQLYTKALLYNSANKIKSRVLNSGDSVLINQFQSWSDVKEFLVKLYKMTNDELKKKNFNIDSIENVANGLEKQISLKSEDFKQSYEKKNVTWKSIQTLLKPDEAAVEVVRFRYFDKRRFTDTIHYAFLIVTNETEEYPELILIEDGNKLEDEWYNEYRNLVKIKAKDTFSFGRFWGKLNDELKDYKKIYFSPDGIYNKLNPSTLMLPEGKFLLDIQEIQQVNSTKDLLLGYYKKQDESNLLNSAVLIGNPNFGLEEEKVKETTRKIRGEKQDEKSYEQLANIRGLSLTRLPGTEKEINDIEKFLKTKSWVINSYLGDMAVKTAVKNANSPRILHIATHGLFLEDVKRSGKELFGFEEQKMVENPLLRSGLFFTGADNYIKKENPGYIEEDNGLLTAYEAMNLNLDKTELVVLSACETGLGEIQNGEGVFGLRRAFQQAGARTVLMSLWKVSDDATQMLMSNFYKNWVSGMTKRAAFAKAQQQVRAKYPEPYYWGAFVMVGE